MKVIKGRKNITSTVAYLAGFLDGEGCIRINTNGKSTYYLKVTVVNTNQKPLELFRSTFGGSVYYRNRGKNKNIYVYEITTAEACDMLKILYNYLIEKKPQALVGIKFHETKGDLTKNQKELLVKQITELKK